MSEAIRTPRVSSVLVDGTGFDSANSDAAVVDLPATAGFCWVIEAIHCGYAAEPTGGFLAIQTDPDTDPVDVYGLPITSAGAAPLLFPAMKFGVGKAVRVSLNDGEVDGYLNVFAHTESP